MIFIWYEFLRYDPNSDLMPLSSLLAKNPTQHHHGHRPSSIWPWQQAESDVSSIGFFESERQMRLKIRRSEFEQSGKLSDSGWGPVAKNLDTGRASQNAGRQYRINADLTLLNVFTVQLVGTDKCHPNCLLVPSNSKLVVGTNKCRPQCWLVPSNSKLVGTKKERRPYRLLVPSNSKLVGTDKCYPNHFLVPSNAKLVGTDKRHPNHFLVPSNSKLVGTDKLRPNRWLVPSNSKLVGTNKCHPNCWLVPSNAKQVGTFQCRPNRWLVPSNSMLVGTNKRHPNCLLVPSNSKLVGTNKRRPNCWLVSSNARSRATRVSGEQIDYNSIPIRFKTTNYTYTRRKQASPGKIIIGKEINNEMKERFIGRQVFSIRIGSRNEQCMQFNGITSRKLNLKTDHEVFILTKVRFRLVWFWKLLRRVC